MIRRIELIAKYKCVKGALVKISETFVVYVAALEASQLAMLIHHSWAPLLAALQQYKTPTKIFSEYTEYSDVFFANLALELPKNIDINKHPIELIEGKQLPYWPIYSLSLVQLKTLQTYIKTHLKTGFI